MKMGIADDIMQSLKSDHSNLIKSTFKNLMSFLELAEDIMDLNP